jgi:diketogulonate reductase-like aldo/keto reductase
MSLKASDYATSIYGVRLPKIIYGTAWKKGHTTRLVEQAIELGFRGIDTACQPKHYNEPGVGEGLASFLNAGFDRADIFLQTKFTPVDGQDPARIPYDPKADLAQQVAQSFETSLKSLQTSYLDSLVLHSPLATEQEWMEVWQAMEAIFDAEGTKQLGISNCYRLDQLEWLYRRSRIKPAVLQNRFYATTGYDRELRDFCRQQGIIYQSFWTLTANPKVLSHSTLQTLASKHRRTPAQVFFRYLTQIDIVPLTGTTSATHMREDLDIFTFELNSNECEAIAGLLQP